MAMGFLVLFCGALLVGIIDLVWEEGFIFGVSHLIWPLEWDRRASFTEEDLFDYNFDYEDNDLTLL